ncbi:glycosyltransferase [Aeoliella sp.]|uniref:glycosyltransferase n=1 Tax=Aeoliella sp. TaxID=2795800 RepID=UPI003CCB9C00
MIKITPAITQRYLVGIHFGWVQPAGFRLPPWASFYFAHDGLVQNQHAYRIPLVSANFTPDYFVPNPEVPKYWDLIYIARNSRHKKLEEFFQCVRNIYDAGRDYKVLLICRTDGTNSNSTIAFRDLAGTYYRLFSPAERERFTLLGLSSELRYLGMSQRQLVYFYQSSKVATLFSSREGTPKMISEALLCGLPVVVNRSLEGGGRRHLNKSNSVQFSGYSNAHLAVIEAVENHRQLQPSSQRMRGVLSEEFSLPKLIDYLRELHELHGKRFDGELINLDRLNLRLPAHLVDDIPWATDSSMTSDIVSQSQWRIFLDHIT